MIENKKQAAALLPTLSRFVAPYQIEIIKAGFDLEEKQFFFDAVETLCNTFNVIDEVCDQAKSGELAIAFFRYTSNENDYYVIEKISASEIQVFVCASLSHICGLFEVRHIPIDLLIKENSEIDLNFKPKALKDINRSNFSRS